MREADNYLAKKGIVLIVEDHQIVREGMRRLMVEVVLPLPVEILEASTLSQARQMVESRKSEIELILLDISLSDSGGKDVLNCLRNEWKGLPTAVVSGCDNWELAASFLKAGPLASYLNQAV